jgi:hypothetical protein
MLYQDIDTDQQTLSSIKQYVDSIELFFHILCSAFTQLCMVLSCPDSA